MARSWSDEKGVDRGDPTGVWIRPLMPLDLAQLVAWDGNPAVARLMGRRFEDLDSAYRWLLTMGPRQGRLAVAVMEGRTLMGDVELEHIVWRSAEAELRICLGDPATWGRGLGTAAMQRVLSWAFGPLRLRRVYLRVTVDNLRAVRLYEKCGFVKRGRLASTGRLREARPVWLMELSAAGYGTAVGAPRALAAGAGSTTAE
ncbi:MAG: GNAT family N-acetyltransferase [Thermaerobacter sp.]|nr:GNAT family N-acetyltransferase [Thermaerobacter sp.]